MELYIGLGITLVVLYIVWKDVNDDYEDFFKF